jgi:hypothetical protein
MNAKSFPCSRCGWPMQPGDACCSHCGSWLASVPAAEAGTAEDQANPPPPPELGQTDEATQLGPNTGNLIRTEVLADLERPAASSSSLGGGQEQSSDCVDLEVRYNNSCVFVLNMQSTFDFEIRPRIDGLRGLFVEVRQSGQVLARETPQMLVRRGSCLSFGLNYMPRNTHAGKVSFEIRVGYRKDQRHRLYAAYRTHTIYSGKEDPRQVCESLVVEVKNNIQQGHAGDMRVDQSFSGLREALRERNTISLDREFLQLINARPFWTVLSLAECAEDSSGGTSFLRRAQPPQHLILRGTDGRNMHLLTMPAARIGRAKDCEIVARVFSASGRQLDQESLRISRYHACLEWQGTRCQILDRGFYADEKKWRPSSTGVRVDGERIPSGREFTFAPGRTHRITLSEPAGGSSPTFELEARLWLAEDMPALRPGCPDQRASPDAPACLILRRVHGPSETFVLLRLAASLAWVDPRCGAACVCFRDNAVHYSDGHACDCLTPGRHLHAGAWECRVLENNTP